jgi:methylated-DNA-[protein]-cysteine S-methyltransferase
MHYDVMASPVGQLTIIADGRSITGLHIEGDRYFAGIPAGWVHDPAAPLLRRARAELTEYFAGRRRHFDLPLAPAGTPFQRQVWEALEAVPAGAVTTYAEVAQAVGRPSAARAVGTAVGRNPICLLIPCHRVLATGGGFGGYVAGLACKQHLLSLEGVAAPA